ncbi:uncharacterized protein LOC127153301 [Labeo rohita]|uniref:uncharacterized protein LOC127153301 n=1 Tax=Labeo rohita TaxID=84645 RepID=UPI0021E30A80|nr:uncharacterized protein LOC127153301 [Labeo rohita]
MIKKMFHTFAFCCLCCFQLIGVFADEVKSVSVMEGESVTLNITVTEKQNIAMIMWKFGHNKSLIAKISKKFTNIAVYYKDANERFRDRLKLDNQTGSLTIMNTRSTDSGDYEVDIDSSRKTTFNVTVYVPVPQSSTQSPSQSTPQSPSQSSSSHYSESEPLSSNSALLISVAAVAGPLLTVAAVGMIWIYRKHRKTDQEVQICEEEITLIRYSTKEMCKNRSMRWWMQVLSQDVELVPLY